MIIFQRIEKKFIVIKVNDDGTKEYYPKNGVPVSRTRCLHSLTNGTIHSWLSDEFKIEEI